MKNNEEENSIRSLGCSALIELLNNNNNELYENNEDSYDENSRNKNYVKEINLFEINNSLEDDSVDRKQISYSTKLLNKSPYSKLSEKKVDLINYNLSFNNNIKSDCFKNTYFDAVNKYNLFLSSKRKYKYKNNNNNNNNNRSYKCLMPYNNKKEIKRNKRRVDLNFFSSEEDNINTYTLSRKKRNRNSEIVKILNAPNKDNNIFDMEESKLKKKKRKQCYEENTNETFDMGGNNTYEKNNIKICNFQKKKKTSHNMLCDNINSPDLVNNFVNKNGKDRIFIKKEGNENFDKNGKNEKNQNIDKNGKNEKNEKNEKNQNIDKSEKNQNIDDIEIYNNSDKCDNEKITKNKNNIKYNKNIMNNISTNKYNHIINEKNKQKFKIYDKGKLLCPDSIDDNKKWNDNINLENINSNKNIVMLEERKFTNVCNNACTLIKNERNSEKLNEHENYTPINCLISKRNDINMEDIKNIEIDKNVENFVFLDFIPVTEEYLKIKETLNTYKNKKSQDNNTFCKKEDNMYIYSIPKSNLKKSAIQKEYEKDIESNTEKKKKTYHNSEPSYIKGAYNDLKKSILRNNIKIINYDYEKNLCYILIRKEST
ncbi:hypothetical protein PRSY57_1143200 [Plasmodium reichenowi]|uniref:Uncharacterized protein n=1 Tax=Plasmodium reichenowi TaxID=5854 RepID=A0A151LCS0_PLARE|nr:hypothetical protein PRSY57_1143200 [Plasmodium reichenowi]KYN96784.1 hypothetical protein PRSY57_1143200 [Plasmodium reichenowi]